MSAGSAVPRGCADRRVVKQRDPLRSPQLREGGLELQRLLESVLDEILVDPLTEGTEGPASKPAAEALTGGLLVDDIVESHGQ